MGIIVKSIEDTKEERIAMPVCPFCYSKKMRKFGFYRYEGKTKQKWLCENCNSVTAYPLHRKPTHRKKRG